MFRFTLFKKLHVGSSLTPPIFFIVVFSTFITQSCKPPPSHKLSIDPLTRKCWTSWVQNRPCVLYGCGSSAEMGTLTPPGERVHTPANGKRIFKRKSSTWKVQDARGILVSSKEVIRLKPFIREFLVVGEKVGKIFVRGKSQIGWLRIRQEYAHHESSEIYPDIPCSVLQHGKRSRNWDMHLGHGRGYLRGDAQGERVIKVRDKQIYHEFRFVLTVLV